jgi:hypothetical protein
MSNAAEFFDLDKTIIAKSTTLAFRYAQDAEQQQAHRTRPPGVAGDRQVVDELPQGDVRGWSARSGRRIYRPWMCYWR